MSPPSVPHLQAPPVAPRIETARMAALPAKLAAGTSVQMTPVKHPADGTWSPPLVNDIEAAS
jgi:hypothetical protein